MRELGAQQAGAKAAVIYAQLHGMPLQQTCKSAIHDTIGIFLREGGLPMRCCRARASASQSQPCWGREHCSEQAGALVRRVDPQQHEPEQKISCIFDTIVSALRLAEGTSPKVGPQKPADNPHDGYLHG